MSRRTPSLYVVAGDTDHWSSTKRSTDIDYGASLLDARRGSAADNWRSIVGAGTRNPNAGEAFVAEFLANGAAPSGLSIFGLVQDGVESSIYSSFASAVAGSFGYQDHGVLRANGAGLHSGLGAVASGSRLSVALYRETGGTLKARCFISGRRNVLGYAEAFDNAAWVKTSATVTADVTSAPPGFDPAIYGKADKLAETAVNSSHYVNQSATVAAGSHTLTFYAKAAERGFAFIELGPSVYAWFNLSTGAVGTTIGGGTYSIESVGAGWYRCRVTATLAAGLNACLVATASADGVVSYAGTAGSGIYIWGAQLEADSSASEYQQQNGAAGGYAGPPVTLTDGAYRLAWSGYQSGQSARVDPDRDGQLHFDSIAKATSLGAVAPWGAAARVANWGGSSPVASKLDAATRTSSSLTLDAYYRVATNPSTNAWWGVRADKAWSSTTESTGPRFLYFEVVCVTAQHLLIGLHKTSAATVNQYPGADANGWGIYPGSGSAYHNGVPVAASATPAAGDRIGVLWDRWNGRIWFYLVTAAGVATIVGAGVPESGTGATFSSVTGTMAPAFACNSVGPAVIGRLCTHAREQIGRPSFAVAWDGSDLMPDQVFHPRLKRGTRYTNRVHYKFPWGSQSTGQTDAPLGEVALENSDGFYDDLRLYDLRGQALTVDRIWPDESVPSAVARALCSAVSTRGDEAIQILSRDKLAQLDTRIDAEAFALGLVRFMPLDPVSEVALTFSLIQTPLWYQPSPGGNSEIFGGGLSVASTSQRLTRTGFSGVKRTAAVTTKQCAREMSVRRTGYPDAPTLFTNGTFGSLAGWTVTETPPNSTVTLVAQGVRLYRSSGGPACSIAQSATGNTTGFLKLTVAAYVSGHLLITDASGVNMSQLAIDGAGTYFIPIVMAGPTTITIELPTTGGDITLSRAEYYPSTEVTDTFSGALRFILTDYAGMTEATHYVPSDAATPAGIAALQVGYYTRARPTYRAAIHEFAASFMGCPYVDALGVLRFAWLQSPDAKTSASSDWLGALVEEDVRGPVGYADDLASALSGRVAYDLNFAPHGEAEVLAGVSDLERQRFLAEHTLSSDVASNLHRFYAHAAGGTPLRQFSRSGGTVYTTPITAYTARRAFYTVKVPRAKVRDWKPGWFFSLTHRRFGLASGKVLQYVGVIEDLDNPIVEIMGWG